MSLMIKSFPDQLKEQIDNLSSLSFNKGNFNQIENIVISGTFERFSSVSSESFVKLLRP